MIYKIELTERSQRVIDVEAENLSEAIKKVAEIFVKQIEPNVHSVCEFSIKEYKGGGA